MPDKHKWSVLCLIALLLAALLVGGGFYIASVHNALWTNAVTDILEVTAQGARVLDTDIQKDAETLHLLAAELSQERSQDAEALQRRVELFSQSGSAYVCADLSAGVVYTDLLEQGRALEANQLAIYRALEGQGVRAPFLDGRTGVPTVGVYERFYFADGAEGYVQKTQPLAEVADRFSLSFYQDKGFSYVVDQQGDILIRSQHRNSNRTFQNLFDVIDLQGNDEQVIASFREALENGKKGVARFRYQQEDYVFCYVPMQAASQWYVVSIVPNRVIMEQANNIVQYSQILLVLIIAALLVLTAFFLLYRYATRRVLAAKEEARQAAESANLAKSRFLSNMSHDIRTPMNAIIGMTKLASDQIDEPELVRQYLKNISLSGQLLVGLINDILDLSKIESGKMTLNNAPSSLEELLSGIVRIVQPMTREKRQRFDVRLNKVQHENLCFDAVRINQVLINLLSNAVKFTPEEGTVSLDVAERPASAEGYAHYTFRVADTGIGMQPEFLAHIFESFTREQDSRVNKIEGSGLGMAITKMIVDMMGGDIQVESQPGQGTVFTVELDLMLAPPPDAQGEPLPPLRVLLADDDPAVCQSAQGYLEELGATVDVTQSGPEAVARAEAAHARGADYDLILLDVRMGDADGIAAARGIRQRVGPRPPVVMVSAYDWEAIQAEAMAAGVNGFLQKPLFKSSVERCLRQYALGQAPTADSLGEPPELEGRRLLLAEDNQLNQLVAQKLLERMGMQVETVDDGQACVERFARSPAGYFDLILMDVHMPVMDGYEATRRIRQMDRPDADVPIFAMTADAFAEDVEAAKQAGMDSHLAKPLNIPAMQREIQRALSRRK
ncbi:MAG: response regulator [Christensenellales bacterium]|jgi:two-component system sensor histidine kinase/response regulator